MAASGAAILPVERLSTSGQPRLSALLGRPVDLVARRSSNTYLREQILADAQPLYAA